MDIPLGPKRVICMVCNVVICMVCNVVRITLSISQQEHYDFKTLLGHNEQGICACNRPYAVERTQRRQRHAVD